MDDHFDQPDRPRPTKALGALVGIISALVAMAVAELVSGLSRDARSPLFDVGDRVIDAVPAGIKDLAISLFGSSDKLALLVGIAMLMGISAAVIGIVTLRGHPLVGAAGVSVFALTGAAAAAAAPDARSIVATLPALVGGAAGLASLLWLRRSATAASQHRRVQTGDSRQPAEERTATADRRKVLVLSGALGAAAFAAIAAGRTLGRRFSAATSRAAVVLSKPARPLPDPPDAASLDVGGISELFTPNAEFYRIDTALLVPQVDLGSWRLRVTGEVMNEIELSYRELLDRPQVEADITLTCVSNEVGGDLLGNARWQGIRLDDLLDRAGVAEGADQVVGRSVDGYTCGFPTAALDGRDALVAVAMNGEPLPLEHGFPARLVVPGLYGYVSATKWLSEIELTRFEDFEQYWVPRGYAQRAPIKMSSRIDTPTGLSTVSPGRVVVGGVAWAQPEGIDVVELRLDDGAWERAELAAELNGSTWRQWRWEFEATGPRHALTVRAIDSTGAIQDERRSEPLPDGATGLHQVVVLVDG